MVNGGYDFSRRTIYLDKDIDLSGHRWVAIGLYGIFPNSPFKGTFDGQGHTISNLTQTIAQKDEGGLFGHVSGGTIKNVTLENVDITIGKSVGGVAGASGATVGSLVGILNGGSVTNCTISDVNIKPSERYDDYSGGGASNEITVGDVVGTVTGGGDVSGITSTNIAVPVDEFTKFAADKSSNTQTLHFIYNNNRYGDGVETNIAPYTVHIYRMDSNGEYPAAPTMAIEFSGEIGVTINAATVYPVPEGYVIDQDKGNKLSGTVTADGKLVLYVYYELSTQTSVSYTITIPNSLEVSGDTKNGEMTITAEGVQIPDTDWLSILVASESDFFFVHSTADSVKLKYSLMVSDSSQVIVNNQEIMRITQSEYQANGSGSLQTVLRAQVTATPQYAGLYTDTLTFTVKYESP
jgi:hypothetical protein